MKNTFTFGAKKLARRTLFILTFCMQASFAHDMGSNMGHDMHSGEGMSAMHARSQTPPPPFVASTAKSFDNLMGDAMAVMEYGMADAPMNGIADHDFVTMMIPHHQGAVDMAKAVLLYSVEPEMRNLAQGIITEQQYEIKLMNLWLQRHPSNPNTAQSVQ